MRSDLLGCTWMHLYAFGSVQTKKVFMKKNREVRRRFRKFFRGFREVFEAFGRVRTLSDPLGPVRTCSDTFGCIPKPSKVVSPIWNFRKIIDIFWDHMGRFEVWRKLFLGETTTSRIKKCGVRTRTYACVRVRRRKYA